MTSPPTVVIAGAGIGGLTAAIALAKRGISVSVAEQADRLEAIGAGIQLSPNASRVLIALGLGERLAPYVVAPRALNIMNARSGRVLARAPLGEAATQRYGAPYWAAQMARRQPCAASSRLMASPSPREPPVTSAT
jgi:salicylate hydroxylase